MAQRILMQAAKLPEIDGHHFPQPGRQGFHQPPDAVYNFHLIIPQQLAVVLDVHEPEGFLLGKDEGIVNQYQRIEGAVQGARQGQKAAGHLAAPVHDLDGKAVASPQRQQLQQQMVDAPVKRSGEHIFRRGAVPMNGQTAAVQPQLAPAAGNRKQNLSAGFAVNAGI